MEVLVAEEDRTSNQQQQEECVCVLCVCACDSGHDRGEEVRKSVVATGRR